jgi:hypothetical protein
MRFVGRGPEEKFQEELAGTGEEVEHSFVQKTF